MQSIIRNPKKIWRFAKTSEEIKMALLINVKAKIIKLSFFFLVGIFILLFCFWVGADSTEDPVTLKLYQIPDPRDTNPFSQANLAVIRAFQEKYPYITLKPFSGISIQGMDMDSQPLLAIAGGISPDIIYVNFRLSETYIQQGFLAPLDEYMKSIPEELQNLRVPKLV